MSEEEMQAMLHYHFVVVNEYHGNSVTEYVHVDRRRYCTEVFRAEFAESLAMLGYTFNGETIKDGRSEIHFTFVPDEAQSISLAIFDCACHDGEQKLLIRELVHAGHSPN